MNALPIAQAVSASTMFDRLLTVRQCDSTQDIASANADGRPGLVVVTTDQSAGRGRFGRTWVGGGGLGLAVTFVVDASDAPALALRAGLGAAMACERVAGVSLGIRWPNDVVERDGRPGGGRKIAGVLVETDGALAMVGVGVNALHTEADWPEQLASRAASLLQIGTDGGDGWRERLLESLGAALVERMDSMLKAPDEVIQREWSARDVLLGSRCVFSCGQEPVEGVVERIEPDASITIQTGPGARTIPAASSTLLAVEGVTLRTP